LLKSGAKWGVDRIVTSALPGPWGMMYQFASDLVPGALSADEAPPDDLDREWVADGLGKGIRTCGWATDEEVNRAIASVKATAQSLLDATEISSKGGGVALAYAALKGLAVPPAAFALTVGTLGTWGLGKVMIANPLSFTGFQGGAGAYYWCNTMYYEQHFPGAFR
jgi:hypothetical protein